MLQHLVFLPGKASPQCRASIRRPGGAHGLKVRYPRLLPAFTLALVSLITGCLNPGFVNTRTRSFYPLAPGDEPFLLVRLVNDTTATLDVPIAYDDGITSAVTDSLTGYSGLSPEFGEFGFLLHWPVAKVGIGTVDDSPSSALATSFQATFPDGSTMSIPAQMESLKAGIDYNEGDTIIFHFIADSRSPYFIQVNVGRIDGSTQTGPFSRADTFYTIRQTLLLNQMYEYLPVTP